MIAEALHLFNGRIWTGDPARPWAASIMIRQGRIESLDGSTLAPSMRVVDAAGRTVAPGLIDSHLHLLRGGKSLSELDLSLVRSRREFQSRIAQRHLKLAPGQWLIASGWSQENWPGSQMPDKSWLAGVGDRPTVCYRMDMHVAVVNDAVLQFCDLQRDPPGGTIQRDPRNNEPTGLMIEAAAWQIVNRIIPESTPADRQRYLLEAQRHAHLLGLTSVGTMEYAKDVADVFEPVRDQLTLRCRVTLLDRGWPMDFSYGRDFRNDDHLAVIGYKAFIDGTLGSRTARMLHDYADDPGNRGLLVELAADGHLRDWAIAVAENGLSPSMHAIGDEAVRLALDAIEGLPAKARPRIEHAQQVDRSDIPRFRSEGWGQIASMQPLHKADDCRSIRKRLSADRLQGTFAFRSLKKAGAVLAFGSDWPVVSIDPLLGIRAAVTGLTLDGEVFGADQNLTVEEALRAYTADAAFSLSMEDAGVLRPGAVGDLVMFARDPFTADWVNDPPRVEMTVAGGQVVYHAGARRQA